jgi:hypothetical protein
MKRKEFLRGVVAAAGTALVAPAMLGGGAHAAGRSRSASRVSVSATTLDATEIAGLRFMREEEKLAHDVYVALYARWGTNVFNNIAASEAQHTQAVVNLLSSYGLADLTAINPPGVFTDVSLQALCDMLMARGRVSEVEALKVGALIEETDMRDLEVRIAQTDEALIASVYQGLLCGSRNHLRAFARQLTRRGVRYVPEVISQAQWDAIANSANESCG